MGRVRKESEHEWKFKCHGKHVFGPVVLTAGPGELQALLAVVVTQHLSNTAIDYTVNSGNLVYWA